MNKRRLSKLRECLGFGVAFCRWNCTVQVTVPNEDSRENKSLSLRLSLFFGPTAQVVSMVGRLTENGDKINLKIASYWIGGSAVRRLQRGCTCADRADGTGWVGLTLL